MTLVAERLRVSVIAGAPIGTAIWAAQLLADKRMMIVEFELDGVTVRVDSDTDTLALEEEWREAKLKGHRYVGCRLDDYAPLLERDSPVHNRVGRRLLDDEPLEAGEIALIMHALPPRAREVLDRKPVAA